MTIKHKIKCSNAMMARIPIMLTAIIVAVCLHTAMKCLLYPA